ncbi:hypothetical protein ONS95_013734 [Cadophora gregata]|uniref:uncharacterized protein n=1 Tax=Cadophora gregata TaxID=51156 RepID=UPI0026DD3B4F|nr:uncharacterized protein ONS95_013734 [Cadophora gregata]KAK0113477.1 hypothetical protein ONS96_014341 [Cadophora gregata f. sp. sojae]KAK0114235.1 hypothetical protein ONS95_013734 [Cadophora gregata]
MADDSENTPFLSDNDHDDETNKFHGEEEDVLMTKTSANSRFKRSIKALTIVLVIFSSLVVMTAIATFAVIQVASFTGYTYNARYVLKDLGICTFISLILSMVMIFIELPVFFSLVIDIVFPILILIYSGNIFGYGWPDRNWCYEYYREPMKTDPHCLRMRGTVRILMGVTGGLSFVTGIFLLVILLLRVIAVSRTKFWKKNPGFTCPTGQYTFSVTLGVMKQPKFEVSEAPGASQGSNSAEGRLIDTQD